MRIEQAAIEAVLTAIRSFPEGEWHSKSSVMLATDPSVIPRTLVGAMLAMIALETLTQRGLILARTRTGRSSYRVYCWRSQ